MSKIVIGGGISGVCCAQELARLNPSEEIIIVTAAETLLEAKSVFAWSKYLEEIDVFEKTADQFILSNPNIRIIQDVVDEISTATRQVHLKNSNAYLSYSRLCICTGVRPKLIADHERIVGIRDLFSVRTLINKIQTARTIVVVGNGGIALELANELTFLDVHWIVREPYIGAAFFDESASDFIMPQLRRRAATETSTTSTPPSATTTSTTAAANATTTTTTTAATGDGLAGCGLGPAWLTKTKFHDQLPEALRQRQGYLQMHLNSEVVGYLDTATPPGQTRPWQWQWIDRGEMDRAGGRDDMTSGGDDEALRAKATAWLLAHHQQQCQLEASPSLLHPFYIITTQGEIVGCDLVISATGVQANHRPWVQALTQPANRPAPLVVDAEGFLVVNERLETSIPGVFAAGDCCSYQPAYLRAAAAAAAAVVADRRDGEATPAPVPLTPPHFFQMRLWTQARIMGTYAAQCLCDVEEDYGIDQHLELFAHVTRFFGFKVVLLGRYNAQGLGIDVERVAKRTVLRWSMPNDDDDGSGSGGGGGGGGEDDGSSTVATAASTAASAGDSLCEHQHHAKRPKLYESGSSTSPPPPPSPAQSNAMIEIWSRVTPGKQFIKLMVYRGRIIGALLIGDTEMEEVFENLILNQLDVTSLGPGLLDPDVDLTDYFD